jgi:Fic family protein
MKQPGRTGRYLQQPQGYSAFIPTPLPPDPRVVMDDEMLALISQSDRALGRLDGSIQTLPDPDLFVFMYVRKEAVLSSQIEGTQSSLNDVLEAEAKVFSASRPRDVNEVINYVQAMKYGLERLKELPVSVRLIKEIHQRLLTGVRGAEREPGELRRSQNWIGPGGCTLNEASFVPPPKEEVPPALSDLERFIHSDDPMPMLIKIGLAHAQFETIHPFLDGNGRVGRLLIAFLLCERKILQKPVLYISHYFRRHRDRYYALLQGTRDDGDWESWLKFFLTAVAEVSDEATETARRIVDLRERHRGTITEHFGYSAGNGLKLLERLYSRPIISVQDVVKLTKVSFTAANNLTRRFVKHGILAEITGQARNRQFRYGQYIDLFADHERKT